MSSRRGSLPGFGLSFGLTFAALGLLVLIPLAALVLRAAKISPGELLALITEPRTLAALRLSVGAALGAALVNVVFGLIVAWVLVRYRFLGRAAVDALVDLPFALPTAVAGIALTAIWAESGWLGQLVVPLGIDVAFTPVGVLLALTFVGLPFVVRSVQPVLAELDADIEEAAAVLGASRWQTFRRVVLPPLVPSLLTGFSLAFARGVGEYGSVIFISGNMPLKTEIAPLLIVTKLEGFDYTGATALAVVMLVLSFVVIALVNGLQRLARRWT
jgi:sulfate/thiosulfate transport system permease protein